MKKPKIKYDESTLNFRVPNNLKNQIILKANELNITLSKYLRGVLEQVHNGTLRKLEEKEHHESSFISSVEFLKLVVWIYKKKVDQKLVETPEELEKYIKTLKRLDEHLPKDIVLEFDKVLANLMTLKTEKSYRADVFYFADNYDRRPKFDYKMLEDFLLNADLV